MTLTKSEIVEELDKIIKYVDPENKMSDADWIARVARGINRLEKLRNKIHLDIHT